MGPLLDNKVLLIPLLAWFIAQTIKLIVASVRDRRFNLYYLVSMGGMPSSHSALVCALATSAAIVDGFGSTTFAMTAILAAIVMYDATGLRQAVGAQSIVLNRMLDELFKGKPAFEQRLRELVGHTKLEVVAGAALGIVLAVLLV